MKEMKHISDKVVWEKYLKDQTSVCSISPHQHGSTTKNKQATFTLCILIFLLIYISRWQVKLLTAILLLKPLLYGHRIFRDIDPS